MNYIKYLDEIMEQTTALGGIIIYVLLIFLSFFHSTLLFISLLSGVVIMYLTTALIRLLYFKERPNKQPYSNLLEKIDASSLPSLHAGRATFLAIIFSMQFPSPLARILLALTALAVAISRIYLQKHDTIDVTAGIILGILVSLIFI